MNTLLLIVLVLLGVLVYLLWKIKNLKACVAKLNKKIQDIEILGKGLSDYKDSLEDKKGQYKAVIMDILKATGRITHHDIQARLEISETSVDRYLQELEKEGVIKQEGAGKASSYIRA